MSEEPSEAEAPRFVLHLPEGLAGTSWEDGDLLRLESCEKIVLGRPGQTLPAGVPQGIRSWPAGLKVLHLWGLQDLHELPPFETCPQLETIDVSGCSALEVLPELGSLAALEWLDAKDCTSLTALPGGCSAGLQFLYLEGCTGLEHEELVEFLHALGRGDEPPRLVELDLARTRLARLPKFRWGAYWDDEGIASYNHETRWQSRRWLEKLVLRGCAELREIALPLELLPNLRHLDVSGCAELNALPALPMVAAHAAPWPQKVLQYLRADGSAIDSHAGSSIRARHRKEGDRIAETRRNAAETFLAWQHFGDPVAFPECRLMVLGNSMAGKSNLVDRLICGIPGADPPGYIEPEGGRGAGSQPRTGRDSTHPIECPTWRVRLEGFAQPATVHVWDYGGQHKYHRTHRTFAGEGILFVIVWPHPDAATPAEDAQRKAHWKREEETPRTLEYWLDYVASCEVCEPEKLSEHVVVVCTQAGGRYEQGIDRVLDQELGKYAGKIRTLAVETVELGADNEQAMRHWSEFHTALREQLARAIERHGVNVPGALQRVAERVTRDRRTCEAWRRARPLPVSPVKFRECAFPSEAQWSALLHQAHGAPVERPHGEALTQALHEVGSLFWLHPPGRADARYVIVDQGAALDWVYRLLHPKNAEMFQEQCRASSGRFGHADLLADHDAGEDPSPLFSSAWQRDRALDIMLQCRLLLRDGERYLATEDALLPDLGDVLAGVHARRFRWERNGAPQRHGLQGTQDHPIGQDAFQDFRAWFLGELRSLVRMDAFQLYRRGFQVEVGGPEDWSTFDPGRREGWPDRFLLEVAWVAFEPEAYGGRLHVRVHAASEEDAAGLWNKLQGDQGLWKAAGCPLGREIESTASGDTPFLLLDAAARRGGASEATFPFGVSARGTNPDAPRVHAHLMGLEPAHSTFFYKGPELRDDLSERNTEQVLGQLGACSVMVLMIDDDYLQPAEANRYCLEELALAAFRFDPGNVSKLSGRLGETSRRLRGLCEDRLGLLWRNCSVPRQQPEKRTLIYSPGVRQDELSGRILAALKTLEDLLQARCEVTSPESSPHWFLKRDLVRVLVDDADAGLQAFNTSLADTGGAIKDFDELLRRLQNLASELPHG
jgi:hypothetical protein